MDRRTAGAISLALGVVCVAMLLSVAYPFSFAEPDRPLSEDRAGPLADADEFHLTANRTEDGELAHGMEAAVSADGARFRRTVTSDSTKEVYQPSPTAPRYVQLVTTDEGLAEGWRSSSERDATEHLIAESRQGDEVRLLLVLNDSFDVADGVPGTFESNAAVHLGPDSERVEGPDGTVRLEPRDGWYRIRGLAERYHYRITDASGSVELDPSTGGVLSADVSWTRTSETPTYAHYLAADGVRKRVRYDVDVGATSVEEPDWVAELRSERRSQS